MVGHKKGVLRKQDFQACSHGNIEKNIANQVDESSCLS